MPSIMPILREFCMNFWGRFRHKMIGFVLIKMNNGKWQFPIAISCSCWNFTANNFNGSNDQDKFQSNMLNRHVHVQMYNYLLRSLHVFLWILQATCAVCGKHMKDTKSLLSSKALDHGTCSFGIIFTPCNDEISRKIWKFENLKIIVGQVNNPNGQDRFQIDV